MVTGKVVANYQWSGDAVYSLDQAEEDDFILNFAVPEESTNIYFDGWVMLKCGVEGDPDKQHAAEAFINFCSRPYNAIRNMYYIGYTSVIAGGDDVRIFEYADWCYGIFEYADWCYGAEEDEEDVVEYPLGYFFSGDAEDEDYYITAPAEQLDRQLGAQYPSADAMARSSIMVYFDNEKNDAINQMWINVRCFNIYDVPVWAWVLTVCVLCVLGWLFFRAKQREKMYK